MGAFADEAWQRLRSNPAAAAALAVMCAILALDMVRPVDQSE